MIYYIFAGILILVIMPVLGFLLYGLFKTYHRGREIPLETLDLSKTHYAPYEKELRDALDEIRKIPYEPVRIKSKDGITLAARYYDFGSDRTVIALHGYRAIPFNNVHAAFLTFMELGFNILLVSHRAHFESGGKYITFGIRESGDLLCWVDYLRGRSPGADIGIFGISMGCATVCYSAKELQKVPEIRFLVLECGYKSGYESIYNSLLAANFGRNTPLLSGVSYLAGRLFLGVDIKRDTNAELAGVNIPAFIIQGEADKFVPVSDSEERYNILGGDIKDLVIVEGAAHAEAFLAGRGLITGRLRAFLGKIFEQEN
ncbi:MAG: alpha/beta hydrolase [Clostridia bacterium]|nr:alpha/beta hydrolase [Clostridia bacterium]